MPRIDNPAAAEKGLAVNEQMKSIAEETGCLFVSNQDNFLCRNGDINEELLLIDGLHLSKLGTERLINNLKLAKTTCCRIGRTQRPGSEPQCPQWSAGHARSGPAQDTAIRHRTDRLAQSFPRTGGPGSGRPMHPNRRPRQSRDKAWPPSQQWNPRSTKPETLASKSTHIADANYVYVQHCTYCGETNHRNHVCRFGMPVNCFQCHRQGHKVKKFVNIILDGPQRRVPTKNIALVCNLDNDQLSKNSDSPDIDNMLLDGNLNTNYQDFIKTFAIPPKFDKSDNDYKTSKCLIGEESFDEISFLNDYHIIKCPADGHCFVHFIVQSFNSVNTSENHINETMLLYLIQSHSEMNAHLYVSCFESKHALLQQMKRYIFDKIYLSLFGDIVVFIAASALNVVVVVIEMKNDKLTKTEIKSRESDCNSKRLYVLKQGSTMMLSSPKPDRFREMIESTLP